MLFQKIVAGAAVNARRDAQILERLSQPPDHPVAIEFPEAELRLLVESWVLQQLSGDQKEAVLARAISYLMTPPPRNSYDREAPTSPLQGAFDRAVRIAVEKVAQELVANDEAVRAKLRELMGAALIEWMAGHAYNDFVRAFSDAMYATKRDG